LGEETLANIKAFRYFFVFNYFLNFPEALKKMVPPWQDLDTITLIKILQQA
jgi:hypothetical protein